MDEVLLDATQFVARCYGCASSESMSAIRYEVWIGKTSMRIVTGAPKLKSLPPTSEGIRAKCEAGTFPSISMESSIGKRPSRTCTNTLWLGRGRSFEIAANRHNIRRRCSCTYVCAQINQVRLCNGPAMRNCQMHVWNCSNIMHHFLWVSWNGRVLQHMDKKVQRYRRRRGQ